VADFDPALDRALDGLIDRAQPPTDTTPRRGRDDLPNVDDVDDLDDLIELATRLQALPPEAWPDPTFPDRLIEEVAQRLPAVPPTTPLRTPSSDVKRKGPRRWGWIGVAAAAAVAAVFGIAGPFTPFGPPQPVSAQVLAAKASAVSAGRGLPTVSFTEVVTTHALSAYFEPAPPPPTVTERETFVAANRWRSDATITDPYGGGSYEIVTVRNGSTITAERRNNDGSQSSWVVTTHAGPEPGLPTASTYSVQINPGSLLGSTTGPCARRVKLAGAGPTIAGRATKVLRLGPNPCPSAALPELNGPATFWIDASTSLVLRADILAPNGQLFEQVQVTRLSYGGTFPPRLFRLPAQPPTTPRSIPSTTLPQTLTAPAELKSRLDYPPLLPTRLPDGLHQGSIQPVATDPTTGRLESFTINYDNVSGHPVLQLYEAPATSPSVRFPGRSVTIRPGTIGTLNTSAEMQILWWIEGDTYISLQGGGVSGGVALNNTITAAQLIQIAARTSGAN
jgi:hypothetical protein